MLFDTHAHMDDRAFDADRTELLTTSLPQAGIALLMNPTNPNVKIEEADAMAGAKKLGLETVTLSARNPPEIDAACSRSGGCEFRYAFQLLRDCALGQLQVVGRLKIEPVLR